MLNPEAKEKAEHYKANPAVELPQWVLEALPRVAKLSAPALAIWIWLTTVLVRGRWESKCSIRDGQGYLLKSRFTYKLFTQICGGSKSTIRKALTALVKHGFIEKRHETVLQGQHQAKRVREGLEIKLKTLKKPKQLSKLYSERTRETSTDVVCPKCGKGRSRKTSDSKGSRELTCLFCGHKWVPNITNRH